ncbi:hypothetical protein Tco_1497716 [Tanacetum coccineum]
MDPIMMLRKLESCSNVSSDEQISLYHLMVESENEAAYNKPLPWIGMYIALASPCNAVAMKLPVDLSNPMLGAADHMSKHGSMAFMCTMMANFFLSLATMNNSFYNLA